jgi:anti-sigma-K factor RskA
MSNPENKSHFEDLAALHAVDFLDDAARKELLDAAQRDPEIEALVRDFVETASLLAHEAPQVEPPPGLRQKILRQLPEHRATSKIISFPQWIPYAVAAGLMILGISQVKQIIALKSQLADTRADASRLRESNALIGLRLATLEAKDASYTSSKVMVAWDSYRNQGVVAMDNLPAAPAGHDYQLWVLDPAAEAPISAGLITGARSFAVKPVSTPNPGFAVSLEPTGGSPEPTGPILFAVAPGV